MIIAHQLSAPLRVTSGPAIQHAGDLAAILSGINEHDVLFIDEIHRMSRPAEELLYMAMEDFRVDVIVGKGPGATAIPLEIPPFTVVGATTRAGLLPSPLRDRFGFTAQLDYYAQRRAAPHRRPLGRPARARRHRRRRPRDRLALARHATHRQPAAAAGARLRRGAGRRHRRREGGSRRAGALRGRRPRPRPPRPRRAVGAVRELRRRPGGRRDARRRRRRGAGDGRGDRRAVPGAARVPGPHAARSRGHPAGLAPSRAPCRPPRASCRSTSPTPTT